MRRWPYRWHLRLVTVLCGSALMTACTTGPTYSRPDVPAAGEWTSGSEQHTEDAALTTWWRGLNDPDLDRLIETALSNSFGVREAMERLNEARARRDAARGGRAPTIDAAGSATRQSQSLSGNPALSAIPGLPRNQTFFDTGLDATWEIDLFGKQSRAIEAAGARVQAASAEVDAARMAVVAEVARTYFELRARQAERAAAASAFALASQTHSLVKARFEAGELSQADVAVVEAEVRSLEAALPRYDSEIQAAALGLGILIGRPPETEASLAQTARALPSFVNFPVGQRADIVRRRPDLTSAERALAAETAEIGVATAELFPKIAFSGAAGFQSLDLGDLGSSASRALSLGGLFSWRLLDGGRVRAEIRIQEVQARRAALAYERTVLAALTESEQALARYRAALSELALKDAAVAAAKRNASLTDGRFRAGDVSLLERIIAERTLRMQEVERAQIAGRTAGAMIALYKALGGGWEAPSESIIS